MGDEPVVDFDSRRRARENAAAADRARQQRERLNETRTTHAPMSREQANAVGAHRRTVAAHADAKRNALRIANCQLCDGDGYTPNRTICDHIDHRPAAARGMAAVRAAMGWDDDHETNRKGVQS